MHRLYAVRTELNFIEVFNSPPIFDTLKEEWVGQNGSSPLHVFGSMYSDDAFGNPLKLVDILQINIPRCAILKLGNIGDHLNGWVFLRKNEQYMELYVCGKVVETYCHKTLKRFRLHLVPVGTPLHILWEPYEYGELVNTEKH